jgi:hypothetical protein
MKGSEVFGQLSVGNELSEAQRMHPGKGQRRRRDRGGLRPMDRKPRWVAAEIRRPASPISR